MPMKAVFQPGAGKTLAPYSPGAMGFCVPGGVMTVLGMCSPGYSGGAWPTAPQKSAVDDTQPKNVSTL